MNFLEYSHLHNNYELIEEIGSGGMARVYRARRRSDGLICAIKILAPAQNVNHEISKRRFDNEIRLTSSISSRYVISVIDYHYDQTEKYIVMEYVNGVTLQSYIAKHGYLSELETLKITDQILQAMLDIHTLRIFHRDLKSSNILIDNFGNIKVIDFGISLQEEASRYTEESKVAVSIQYMAPELVVTREPTEQSEIYAIGILMYEMLIGKTPYSGTDVEVLSHHISRPITDVNKLHPELTQALTNVVIRATAKQPQHRFQTFQDMKNAIALVSQAPITSRVDPTTSTNLFARHRRRIYTLGALLLVMLVILALLFTVGR